jgi:UDP-glucuronate decarboxylase
MGARLKKKRVDLYMPQNTARYRALVRETAGASVDWPSLKGARVMITGASGLIGSFLTDLLMARNEWFDGRIAVLACVRNLQSGHMRFAAHASNPAFTLFAHDVTRPFAPIGTVDYIVHAAGNATPSAFSADPAGTLTGAIEGAKNVLDLARECGARRLLMVSSGEVYGRAAPEDLPFSEDFQGYIDLSSARSCYPVGKRAAETLLAAYAQQYGIDGVVARPCHVYGPTPTPRDNRAATQFLLEAAAGRDIVMKSEGLQKRSYLHVADCALGLLTAMLRGAAGSAYNVASAKSELTVAQLAALCAQAGGTKIVMRLPGEMERRGYAPALPQVMNALALEALGFNARFEPEAGLANAVGILRESFEAKGHKTGKRG